MKVSIALCFLWLGFLLAISFFEAPLKFQAPSLSLVQGVEIGRIIFFWMNKIELCILGLMVFIGWKTRVFINFPFIVLAGILFVQTLWLLPELDEIAKELIENDVSGNPLFHKAYVICEVGKLVSLIVFGSRLLKDI